MSNSSIFSDVARRLRRTDLLLLRAVRRQRARPAMRAKGQFWGSVITDDEVDALLRAHGEIDYPSGADGLEDAIAASTAYRDAPGGKFGQLRGAFKLDGDDAVTDVPPPLLGQHTDAILGEMGFGADEVAAFRAAGVV
jgi:crotonobetainyl-CoA:carnitine CoA-transferase CaiB-like acyl-CoA transferase